MSTAKRSTLGANDAERREQYPEFLRAAIADGEWSLIRDTVQCGQLTGTDRFVEKVEAILGKRIEKRSRGRPPKAIQDLDDLRVK